MSSPQAPAPSLALVVVDLMPRVIEQEMAPHGGAAVVERAVRLADAFRAKGLPVALVVTERANVAEHENSVARIFPRFGEVTTTAEVQRDLAILEERG